MMLWIGLYSPPFIRRLEISMNGVQQRIEQARTSGQGIAVQRHQSERKTNE